MKSPVRLLPWLAVALVACDRAEQSPEAPAAEPGRAAERATKSSRREPAPVSNKKAVSEARTQLDIADSITDPAERNQAIAKMVWELVEIDPDLAREAFSKLPAGHPERANLMDFVAMRLAAHDPESAVEWASRLGPVEERSAALGAIAQVIAQENPERAATMLADNGMAGRQLDVSVVQVIRGWAGTAPEDAAAWVNRFPPGEARSQGMRALLSAWADRDPKAAYKFVGSVPNPTFRQEAVQAMAEAIVERPVFLRGELLKAAPPEVQAKAEQLDAANRAEMEGDDDPLEMQE